MPVEGRPTDIFDIFVSPRLLPLLAGSLRMFLFLAKSVQVCAKMSIPVGSPGPSSALAEHIRKNGWQWSEELLVTVTGDLAADDIRDLRSDYHYVVACSALHLCACKVLGRCPSERCCRGSKLAYACVPLHTAIGGHVHSF